MLRRPVSVTLAVVLAAALAGCSAQATSDGASPVALSVDAPVAPIRDAAREPDRVPLELVPAAQVVPSAAPTTAPPKPAAPSFDVAAVQRQLTEQRYYVGAIDGKAGGALKSAVMAFQKVNGLAVDGGVGASTLAALAAPRAPKLEGGPSNRVEVDLTKQVLYVVKGGAVDRILPVSSGNGATYKNKDGSTARALTPVGHYKIQRRIVGERHAPLGTLYDPQYFYQGWAIHGSNSVPAGPASHGCIRVTRTDAKWLLNAIGNGTHVYLYGGRHVFTAGSKAPGTEDPNDVAVTTTEPTAAPEPTTTTAPPSQQPSSPPPSSGQPSSPPPAGGQPTSPPPSNGQPTQPAPTETTSPPPSEPTTAP